MERSQLVMELLDVTRMLRFTPKDNEMLDVVGGPLPCDTVAKRTALQLRDGYDSPIQITLTLCQDGR